MAKQRRTGNRSKLVFWRNKKTTTTTKQTNKQKLIKFSFQRCLFHVNSPEKWLHNRIYCYCPSNRSKQIQETHTARAPAHNVCGKVWLKKSTHGFTEDNFAAYIVCRRYKPCEFLGFVWTDCWGNKSYYIITSPANMTSILMITDIYSSHLCRCLKK